MNKDHLLYSVEKNVARLTINREAQRNAIGLEAIELFVRYLDDAEQDENVRAILITGSGDKAFCSGADLGGAVDGRIQQGFKSYAKLITRLSGYPKPVVARVNGACMAMNCHVDKVKIDRVTMTTGYNGHQYSMTCLNQ